jgi:F0F1-type ATP synthase membrane subunit b/b'
MAARRKPKNELDEATTRSKLSRLLETESEIDAMLSDARREAADLVEQARTRAEERVRALEGELDASRAALAEQVAKERDAAIAAVRAGAQDAVGALDELDERAIAELSRYVVDRVIEATSGGDS